MAPYHKDAKESNTEIFDGIVRTSDTVGVLTCDLHFSSLFGRRSEATSGPATVDKRSDEGSSLSSVAPSDVVRIIRPSWVTTWLA